MFASVTFYRIPNWQAALMISLAVVYDLLQAILTGALAWIGIGFLGAWLITLWAGLTFGLWFTLRGASIMSGRRAASLGLGALVESLPLINGLPGWTVAVISALVVTRYEDRRRHQKANEKRQSKI